MVKVSVIMPVYNSENELASSINSFLKQDLKDIELICINDGSSDHSLQVLEDFAKQDPRIVVFSQDNAGSARARNKGIQLAKGEYLCFLDADDQYVDQKALMTLYDLAKKYDAEAAGGSLSRIQNGVLKDTVVDGVNYAFTKETVLTYQDLQQAFYYQRFIFSRDMILRNKIQFPNYKRFQDAVFLPKALSASNKIAVTNKATYLYSVPNTNKFTQFTDEMVNDFLQGHIDVLHFSFENKYDQLFAWCMKRFYQNKIVTKMMQTSIASGNTKIKEYVREVQALIEKSNYPISLQNKDYLDVFLAETIFEKEEEIIEYSKAIRAKAPIEPISDEPLVSFIVPAYNIEKYIGTTIESILQQPYQNLEVICVNDGSTDRTLSIIEEWEKKDSRVKVITKQNGGLSLARNTGLEEAKGKYIRFVDGDDAVTIDSTWVLVSYAERNNLDLISFNGQAIFESYDIAFAMPNYLHYYNQNVPSKAVMPGIDLLVLQHENKTYRVNIGLFFFRKDFLVDHELYFKEGILHEDNLYSFSSMLKSQRSMCIDEIGFLRRFRQSSIMTEEFRFENVYGLFVSYLEMKDLLRGMKLDDAQLEAVNGFLNSRLEYAMYNYNKLSQEEKEKYHDCLRDQTHDFEALVKNPVQNKTKINNLEREVAKLKNEASKKDASIANLSKEITRLQTQNEQLEIDRNFYQNELHIAHNSYNWKIGKLILFLPKKVYYLFKKLMGKK